MLQDVTLGQFFPGNSVIHRLDSRTKLIITVLYIVALFMASNVLSFALMLAFSVLIVLLSRISLLMIMRGLKPVILILIITMLFNLFGRTGEGAPLVTLLDTSFITLRIYKEGVLFACVMALRVLLLIVGTSVFLTYTTSPITLTDAIENLLGPLKKIRVPVHEFAMMMTIALRFIPTLVEETNKIMNAQKARGADFSTGGLIRRAKALVPILIPLFISAFRRAEDLAVAMECRCYRGGNGRTKLNELRYHGRDYAWLFVCALMIAVVVLINIYSPVPLSV